MGKKDEKILFVINAMAKGGAEGVFVNDINALHSLGFDVQLAVVYGLKNDKDTLNRLAIPEEKIWFLGFKSLYDIKSYLNLVKKIRKEKIKIIYSTLDDANFIAKVTRIFGDFRLFCREANTTHDKPLKFKTADIILNFLVYRLVMVAEAVKDSYASYDPFRKNKMVVLYNGVEVPARVSHGSMAGSPVKIIAVGSFTPKKGFEDLISIFKDYVLDANKNFILEIIGDGVLFDKISSKIKEYGMDDKIKCLGPMDKGDLKNHYMNSDIFVLTSKKEGCPNVLLEAMSYGLAPVSFSVGAVPEIIENGVSGFVIPKGDKKAFGLAVSGLLENPGKIKNTGNMAREEIVKRFSFDSHLKNLLNVLELKI